MRKLLCYIFKWHHDWHEWNKDNKRYFITCKHCHKTLEEVWDDFSSFYYCEVGMTKEELLDKLSGVYK